MSLPPFFPYTRRRPLIEWIVHLFSLPCTRWVSVHPFFTGSVCFVQVLRVVLMSMVICPLSLSFLLVFPKVVLCPPCCICRSRKSLVLIFEPIHVSQAFLSLGLRRPFRPVLNTLMIHHSLLTPSDDSILVVFDAYPWFQVASGARLNVSKSKGL
mgnify:CR=1 FL=1